jgi:hypothetical protein
MAKAWPEQQMMDRMTTVAIRALLCGSRDFFLFGTPNPPYFFRICP